MWKLVNNKSFVKFSRIFTDFVTKSFANLCDLFFWDGDRVVVDEPGHALQQGRGSQGPGVSEVTFTLYNTKVFFFLERLFR